MERVGLITNNYRIVMVCYVYGGLYVYIVYCSPVDLVDLATQLCDMLLQISSTVYCEDRILDDQRRKSLEALLVMCPTLVAPHIIRSLYSQSTTITGKLDIMSILREAAKELSGSNINKKQKEIDKDRNDNDHDHGHRHRYQSKDNRRTNINMTSRDIQERSIQERVEKKTRRL